jgi:DNA-binding NarL/FixJ family response regulator
MMRSLFLVTARAQPSPRWMEAFPEGMSCSLKTALVAAKRADIIWLNTVADDWMDLFAKAQEHFVHSAIVVVSDAPDIKEAVSALTVGARGYCHAWASSEQLRGIAQVVGHGGYWLGPELVSRIVNVIGRKLPAVPEALPGVLTVREAEVARHVAAGLSNKEIAALLGLSVRTIKAHLSLIFDKLGVRDRLQLAVKLSGRRQAE